VLTLVVTPSALMVFTRDAPQAGAERPGMLARLFRRGTGKDEAAAEDAVSASPLPKAAE
jgi:multidrug efflux pump